MNVNEVNWPAVRAFRKLMQPVAASHDEAAFYDAKFDGGEFSGPAHDRMYQAAHNRVMAKVAERFGIEPAAFESMCFIDLHHEECCMMIAIMEGTNRG